MYSYLSFWQGAWTARILWSTLVPKSREVLQGTMTQMPREWHLKSISRHAQSMEVAHHSKLYLVYLWTCLELSHPNNGFLHSGCIWEFLRGKMDQTPPQLQVARLLLGQDCNLLAIGAQFPLHFLKQKRRKKVAEKRRMAQACQQNPCEKPLWERFFQISLAASKSQH